MIILGAAQVKAKEKGKQAAMMADSRICSCPRLQKQQVFLTHQYVLTCTLNSRELTSELYSFPWC